MEREELLKEYDRLFPPDMTWEEVSARLKTLEDHPNIDEHRKNFCDFILYMFTGGYYIYDDWKKLSKSDMVTLFVENVSMLPETKYFFHAVAAFFCGNQKQCIAQLKKLCSTEGDLNQKETEESLVVLLIEPFKNAFPGFWTQMQELFQPLCEQDGTDYLCQLMADYYACKSNEKAVDILTAYIQKYPNITTAKEYLACTYYDLKMWNNAIAYLESIQTPVLFRFTQDCIHFMLAWAYGKIRDLKQEELHYRECLKLFPAAENALNNLGYCLYKQKRYQEARELFERCLEEKRDLPYAANNYARVLIRLGQYKEAKQFANETDYKLSKSLRERVKKLPGKNEKQLSPVAIILDEQDEEVETAIEEKKIDLGGKREQFSSEKLLEDELTLRIESGLPVFGMKLHMYKRPGEYGRQYIIPIGRLDLLCEDEAQNLYVIELKKDSGYDDVYQQITDYLDWFKKSKKFGKQTVYGIICLNDPTQKLVRQVHDDPRLRLFEYRISYQEI